MSWWLILIIIQLSGAVFVVLLNHILKKIKDDHIGPVTNLIFYYITPIAEKLLIKKGYRSDHPSNIATIWGTVMFLICLSFVISCVLWELTVIILLIEVVLIIIAVSKAKAVGRFYCACGGNTVMHPHINPSTQEDVLKESPPKRDFILYQCTKCHKIIMLTVKEAADFGNHGPQCHKGILTEKAGKFLDSFWGEVYKRHYDVDKKHCNMEE